MPRRSVLPLVMLLLATALPALAQDKGGITGRVTDKRTGHAIPFATVTLLGARRGGLTDSEGQFQISGLTPGSYDVRIQFLGYKTVDHTGVIVSAGKPAVLDIRLEDVVVHEEKMVEVSAERRLVEVRQGATIRGTNAAEIRNLSVATVNDVLQRQAGISSDADQIHVRGGRSDETVFVVNGVANRDLVTGQSTAGQLNARSVSEVNVATGAYDVRYGNALSGVVEVKLRDANEKFQLGVTTATSSYGGRAWQVVVSGRDPIFQPLLHAVGVRAPGEFSSILDVSSSLYETRYRYLDPVTGTPWEQFQQNFFRPEPTYRLLSSYEDSFFGYHFKYPDMFAPAADNQWAARYGLTWKPSASNKLTFDFSKRIAIDQGFSRVRLDVNGLESDPAYPWRWQRRIDHAGTFFEDNVQSSVEWRRTLSSTGYFNLQLSRYFFAQRQDVQAKTWTDYEQPNDIDAFPNDSRSSDYFWDTGDDNVWADRHTNTISMVGSVVKRHHRNEMEMGLEHNFQSVQYLTIQDPWKYDPSGLGSAHDLWLVHPWVGDLYVRDRLEYEGFTANFGLRADYWFMGREVEAAIADTSNRNVTPALRDEFYNDTRAFFGRRYKLRWSPRIIVAHPITENSSFFFNYGIFTQIPSYQFVYSKLTSVSSESYPKLGNPNLNPEVSINYELGAKHQFTRGSAANLTFFVKDTYDYPDAVTYQVLESSSASGPTNYTAYLNGSFARSKGFEIEIEKRRTRFWSGRVTYTFSQTRGKSSDPNDQRASVLNGGTASETPVTEHFVTWNRPHKLGVSFDMRFDREAPAGLGWMKQAGLNLYVQGESGRAYTPLKAIGDNQTRAVGNTDSRNAPFQTFTDLKFNRYFKTSAGKLDFSVACKNLFSTHSINRVDPVTGQGRVWGVGSYDPVYFPNVLDNDPYVKNRDIDDPSNYGPGAQWRLQFDYDF